MHPENKLSTFFAIVLYLNNLCLVFNLMQVTSQKFEYLHCKLIEMGKVTLNATSC